MAQILWALFLGIVLLAVVRVVARFLEFNREAKKPPGISPAVNEAHQKALDEEAR